MSTLGLDQYSVGLLLKTLRPRTSISLLQPRKNPRVVNSCHGDDNARRSSAMQSPSSGWWEVVQADHDEQTKSTTCISNEEGMGIIRFLKGKHLFITGSTGFLAKVLIEKILRTIPDVGKIYVLIKAKDKEAALQRLKTEIIYADIFKYLQESHGNNYESFMLAKLIPVAGDVREARLGIEEQLAEEISKEVDLIVNSAANTTFDERYDVALDVNTMGPCRLMNFAKRFKRLKLFVHVSTAYVNGQRQGRVLEKPFCMGDTIAREMSQLDFPDKFMPCLDIETELKLAFTSGINNIQDLKDIGLSRARMYGWQDTYVLTKAMGEMVINSMRGDIPVVTIRPSVIERTLREPFPGWIEGNRMMDPILLSYGKGRLTGFLLDPDGVLDVVPVDMVSNAMLAAMAKHGQTTDSWLPAVYHVASSTVNPVVLKDLFRFFFQHFTATPRVDSRGMPIAVKEMKLFTNIDEFSSYVQAEAIERSCASRLANTTSSSEKSSSRMLENIFMKSAKQAKHLADIYGPYTSYGGRFDITNTQKLMEEMSEEEMLSFGFDVGSVNWEDYITNVHIPGVRKHVLKELGGVLE